MPSSAANGTAFVGAVDVVFRPNEFTSAITNDFATVPSCSTDFVDYGNTTTDHLAAVNNPNAGIGDICRYMGVVDDSKWRIPTAKEWAELYGSDQTGEGQALRLGNAWTAGNYYPLSGYAFGPGRDGVKITHDGADTDVTNADPWINGAIFLPASGRRNWDTGNIYYIGDAGYFWSSTLPTTNNGYCIQFNSSYVWPQYSNIRINAFSIRCIRE